ncbi:helix-turn-helix domain-containing protein [Dickeya ananatis]|uniref:helix-turn-helix domain-containing protein n=1 Tax=Dickeya ananatis TaxID=3061286 RepID=UPI00388D0947
MEPELKHRDGVREKKRREMYRRITDVGLRLFAEHGYEATTLDAIAEASGIARRTFFHYFRSKEEIILAWQKALPDELYAEIVKRGVEAIPNRYDPGGSDCSGSKYASGCRGVDR